MPFTARGKSKNLNLQTFMSGEIVAADDGSITIILAVPVGMVVTGFLVSAPDASGTDKIDIQVTRDTGVSTGIAITDAETIDASTLFDIDINEDDGSDMRPKNVCIEDSVIKLVLSNQSGSNITLFWQLNWNEGVAE